MWSLLFWQNCSFKCSFSSPGAQHLPFFLLFGKCHPEKECDGNNWLEEGKREGCRRLQLQRRRKERGDDACPTHSLLLSGFQCHICLQLAVSEEAHQCAVCVAVPTRDNRHVILLLVLPWLVLVIVVVCSSLECLCGSIWYGLSVSSGTVF